MVLPSFLALHNTVLAAERKWIVEHQARGLKADFVLPEIPAVLDLIPFKAHSA